MVTEMLTRCDAYGTIKDVQHVIVTAEAQLLDGTWAETVDFQGDLSKRGRTRLLRFIERGFSSAARPKPAPEPAAPEDVGDKDVPAPAGA